MDSAEIVNQLLEGEARPPRSKPSIIPRTDPASAPQDSSEPPFKGRKATPPSRLTLPTGLLVFGTLVLVAIATGSWYFKTRTASATHAHLAGTRAFPGSDAKKEHKSTASIETGAVASDKQQPQAVSVGAFITNLYEINSERGTFNADMWVWSVSDATAKYSLKDSLDINYVDSRDPLNDSVYLTSKTATGADYQQKKIRATFLHSFDLENFPFDHQRLEVRFEDNNDMIAQRVYVPDTKNSAIAGDISLEGWRINTINLKSAPHTYHSSFGDPDADDQSVFSQLIMTIDISRDAALLFVKMTIGLVVAVMLAMFSCFMPTHHGEIFSGRMVIVSTSLFAIVLNQQFVDEKIGARNGITLIDKLHILGMVAVLVYLILTTISRRIHEDLRDERVIKRIDRYSFIGGFLAFWAAFLYFLSGAIASS